MKLHSELRTKPIRFVAINLGVLLSLISACGEPNQYQKRSFRPIVPANGDATTVLASVTHGDERKALVPMREPVVAPVVEPPIPEPLSDDGRPLISGTFQSSEDFEKIAPPPIPEALRNAVVSPPQQPEKSAAAKPEQPTAEIQTVPQEPVAEPQKSEQEQAERHKPVTTETVIFPKRKEFFRRIGDPFRQNSGRTNGRNCAGGT